MIPEFFRSLLRFPGLAPADWEQLRLAIFRRSLALLLPVILIYCLATASLGSPVLPALAGLGFTGMVLLLLTRHPEARRMMVWVLAFAASALLAMASYLTPGDPPTPLLLIVVVLPTVGLMLDGAALAAFYVVAAAALLGWEAQRLPDGDTLGATNLGIRASAGLGLLVSAAGWAWGIRRGRLAIEQAKAQLLQQRDERQVLALALFHELVISQSSLQAQLGTEGPVDWNQTLEGARQMQERAIQIRGLRNSLSDPPLDAPVEADFGRGLLLAMLWTGIAMSLAGFLVWLGTGQGAAWHGLLSLAVLGGVLWTLRGRRSVAPPLAWTVVLLGPAILMADGRLHWGQGLPSTAVFWCLSILNAGLLLGWRVGVGLAVFGAIFNAGALAAAPYDPRQLQQGLALAFAFMLVLLVYLQAVAWQRSLIQALDESRRQLAQGLAQRRRLLGTLFHDVANPLTALLTLAEQGRAGMAAPGDAARARRLCLRLHELLADSQAWLMSDGEGDAQALRDVELGPVLAGMADLYQERLAAKRLGLSLEVEAGLMARAQTAVLRDSVLSNLMSNAIKFSRPGSSLELEAMLQDGRVCIELRDRGEGIPPELLLTLEVGQDLPSRPGSGGELGQGLGLALAREHLQRMGGRLDLLPREGGGTVSRIVLERA